MTTILPAQLEIDHNRGVIYVHVGGISVLRICRVPTPIPYDVQMDLTHMHGFSSETSPIPWDELARMQEPLCTHGRPQGQVCPQCDIVPPYIPVVDQSHTEQETLDKIAIEWLEVRSIIMRLLADIGVQGKEALEHNAAAVIARLSHAGYSIDKIEENDNK